MEYYKFINILSNLFYKVHIHHSLKNDHVYLLDIIKYNAKDIYLII